MATTLSRRRPSDPAPHGVRIEANTVELDSAASLKPALVTISLRRPQTLRPPSTVSYQS